MTSPARGAGTGGPAAAPATEPPGRQLRGACSWWDAVALGSLEALGRPELWLTALLGFLVRGGLLLFLLPIVALPSPVGIASFVGLGVLTIGGDPTPHLVVSVVMGGLVFVAWLLLGGLLAAATDVALVGAVLAGEDGVPRDAVPGGPARPVPHPGLLVRLLLIRLVSLLPLAVALGWWATRIVDVAYRELTVPLDLATPIAVRALLDAADADIAVLIAWLFTEAYGALAARRLMLGAASVHAALAGGLIDLLRRPLASLATLFVASIGSLVLVAPPLVAAWIAWSRLALAARVGVPGPAAVVESPGATVGEILGPPLFLLLLVVAWLGGLALAGAASAWRSALWTLEAGRSKGVDPRAARSGLPISTPLERREGT